MRKNDASPDVIIAGHAVIDYIFDQRKQAIPRKSLGGPVSYSSLALSSLGYPVEVITKVGGDFPESYSLLLRRKGGVRVQSSLHPKEKTTSFRIDRHKQAREMWLLNKCIDISLDDVKQSPNSSNRAPKVFVVNTVAGEMSLELLEEVSRRYEHVLVDSQGFVRRFSRDGRVQMRSGVDMSSLSRVEFLKADSMELQAWSGSKDMDSAIRRLSTYVHYIITTAGAQHVKIFEGQRLRWKARPPAVRVNDTTGAGDIFLAVFAASYSRTERIKEALATASSAASLALESSGIEKAILDRNAMDRMVHSVEVLEY